jgi:hypothetical protein
MRCLWVIVNGIDFTLAVGWQTLDHGWATICSTRVLAPAHLRLLVLLLGSAAPFLSSCRPERRTSALDAKTFADAGEVLDSVARSEVNGIPEAVLNRTRCLVVLPANSDQGVVSCLEALNRWARPDPVLFSGERRGTGDLLIFVLGKNQADQLRSQGKLPLNNEMAGGPLARSKPVLTDADLNFGGLFYARQGDSLSPGSANGGIRAVRVRPPGETSSDDRRLQMALTSFFNVITPAGIIIHHSGVLPTSRAVPRDTAEVDAYHSQRGFTIVCFGREYHVAYHYLILPDGEVQAGRPERCQGAHARGYNAYLGISVAGDFGGTRGLRRSKSPAAPTPRQETALIALVRRLRQQYGIPLHRIMQHSDVASTECPGAGFPIRKILHAIGEEK